MRHRMKVPRLAAVIENDVLIEFPRFHVPQFIPMLTARKSPAPPLPPRQAGRRRVHAELLEERLRAVMAGAHRHAVLIEQGREIMRMNALDIERENAEAPLPRADKAHPWQTRQTI